MKGSRILVTSKPRGVFEDVFVTGTPKPGTVMEITPATEPIGGVFNYSVYGTTAASGDKFVTADGNRKCIAVLIEDDAQGKTYDDAYVTGTRGRIYFPVPGEQLNMLIADVAGTTSDTYAIGDELMVDDGTGKLMDVSSPEAAPFTLLETVATGAEADHVRQCRFNGEGGA